MAITFLDVEVANPSDPERWEPVHFLIDSGTLNSVVPAQVLDRLGIKALTEQEFRLADGSTISVEGPHERGDRDDRGRPPVLFFPSRLRGGALVASPGATPAAHPVASIVRDVAELRTLKAQPGKNVYVVGGATLVASLLNEGLIDELRLIVHPLVLGKGQALFGGVNERLSLDLVEVKSTESGRVVATYRTRRAKKGE